MPAITREQFDQMRNEFGHYGSWAIWAPGRPGAGVKDGIDDISIFDDEAILTQLHADYVIVALNISGPIERSFGNFHSDSPRNNDYKMRHAFHETPLWGSYMTDILKDISEVDSRKITSRLDDHLKEIGTHAEVFRRELQILNAENARIITLGALAENLTRFALNRLGMNNEVRRIYHYAHYISKENYRAHVLDKLIDKGLP